MSDFDVSKIDVGWRVQLNGNMWTNYERFHGEWVTICERLDFGFRAKLGGKTITFGNTGGNFLAALPPEPVKDPFAVGEWVVCVEEDKSCCVGDIIQIDREHKYSPDIAFSSGGVGYFKSRFRPATPEEIAAHLGTTTPTNTILDRAKSIITGNRQTTNGKPERSFHKIAERWSLTLGTPVTAQQVALMMVDLKMVRALEGVTTEGHDDHFVDMAGYVALASELGE